MDLGDGSLEHWSPCGRKGRSLETQKAMLDRARDWHVRASFDYAKPNL